MRTIACCLFLSLTASEAISQNEWHGQLFGKRVYISLSTDVLKNAPRWNPNDPATPGPPLSVEDALRIARKALHEKHPVLKEVTWSISLTLQCESMGINNGDNLADSDCNIYILKDKPLDMVLDSWVYWIRFAENPLIFNGRSLRRSPSIPIAVLMDGTVLLPSETLHTADKETLETSYEKIQTMP